MRIVAVIPVRGGSKGIPRKNVRLMNGKPLLLYSVENAKACPLITDIVITTDDEEIISIARMHGIDYVERDKALAADNITLDPVIYDAVLQMEARKQCKYDIVITLQATSPLLSKSTLDMAIKQFMQGESDTCISVVNRPHLSWKRENGTIVPAYSERLNRQQLPANYSETGAFFITRREWVTDKSRLGKRIEVFEVPEEESVDIDSMSDWQACENILRRKRIIFRVDGHKNLGMGHIYRCMTLAYNLTGHEIMFVLDASMQEGIEKIQATFLPYHLINKEEEFFEFLNEWKADIVVNDRLDTQLSYIKKIKRSTHKVVTFEDLGEGTREADLVINALYDVHNDRMNNTLCGEKYICLRDEFQVSMPRAFSEEVNHILVMFGGTDPLNLTERIYDLVKKIRNKYQNINYTFILGSGYVNNKIVSFDNVTVVSDVKRVSDYMREADLAFTSQGRTVYELASQGVPAIVLAQNEREQLHSFAQMQNGFLNLGLGAHVTDSTIESTLEWVIKTTQVRKEMRELMLKHDLKSGLGRVVNLILKEE